MSLPASNIKFLLYISARTVAKLSLSSVGAISNRRSNSATVWTGSLFMLLFQAVEPVPVQRHRPEHFIVYCSRSPFTHISKYDTLAERASPINTSFNAKLGKILGSLLDKSTSLGMQSSTPVRKSVQWRFLVFNFPFPPSRVIRSLLLWNHWKSP